MNAENLRQIEALLTGASRALGLRLCFHDRLRRTGRLLPLGLKAHVAPCCLAAKEKGAAVCLAYDLGEVHRALAARPGGRIHTCPHGVTELAVPVHCDGAYVGVLFAGPCWRGRGRPPHPDMMAAGSGPWLPDRLILLRGIAAQLANLLREPQAGPEGDRHGAVIACLRANLKGPVGLGDLARHLSLSPSRARHVVRNLFGKSFRALLQSIRLDEAAFLLSTTDLPIGEVSRRVGYPDQGYFTRVFSREYKLSPRAYRRRHQVEP